MAYVIVFVLLVGVVLVVTSPLRSAGSAAAQDTDVHGPESDDQPSSDRLELEAARDAKFREIRDAELDHQTGKLSDDDFIAIHSTLRAEATELLHQLDALDE